MKVLKYGSDVKVWRYTLTCYVCKSQLEVEADDLRYAGEAGDWHDAGWESYTISCAACGTSLDIPTDKIPTLVKVHAEKRKKKF